MTKSILMLIDHLGCGGAQRQFSMLACFLKIKGYKVTVLCYQNKQFFKDSLDDAKIPIKILETESKVKRVLDIRRFIRKVDPDVVLSFLETPSLIAELASFPFKRFKLIVSERSCDEFTSKFLYLKKFAFHRLADNIVCNSYAQCKFVNKVAPYLTEKVSAIHNCVDFNLFKPSKKICEGNKILVLGNFYKNKNPINFFKGFKLALEQRPDLNITVDWYGENFFVNGQPSSFSLYFTKLNFMINQSSMQKRFKTYPLSENVARLFKKYSVFCLPSVVEAFPNVIGEAMACGLPILASDVGDNGILVRDGENGFLFRPNSINEIAKKIIKFFILSDREKYLMGKKSRFFAEELLSSDLFIDKYIKIINQE